MTPWRRFVRRLAASVIADAEAETRLARDRLRDALEAIPEGVVFLDAEGRYVLWNKTYAEIYHRSADLFEPGARLIDTLREGVRRGDYPDAIGNEEAWLADRVIKLTTATGQRHEQRLADGRWLMIEERRTTDGGVKNSPPRLPSAPANCEMKYWYTSPRTSLARPRLTCKSMLENRSISSPTIVLSSLGWAKIFGSTSLRTVMLAFSIASMALSIRPPMSPFLGWPVVTSTNSISAARGGRTSRPTPRRRSPSTGA